MSGTPEVSVVMSVYNGAETLAATLDSVLTQEGVDFELIAVDDGSTDASGGILDEYAQRDARVIVIHQPNAGLTRALIAGCRAARAPLIARQDAGDRSRPDRLRKQRELMGTDPEIVLVTCHSQHLAPGGEPLYVATARPGEEIRRSLLRDDAATIRGLTAHGSAMFRRDAYFAAGEYRPQFRFGQDMDLWIRLAALGQIGVVPEILFEVQFEPRAISGVNRPEQLESLALAVALRDTPADTAALLERAARIGSVRRAATPRDEANALYFIASCLRRERNAHWRRYAWQAVRLNPLHFRAWGRLLTNL
jgi:glycosyltransferase involved in cell wall biosynthesis